MLVQHIALVSVTDDVGPAELARVGAALQTQVTRDLAPMWNIAATVDAFPNLDDVLAGYWPIIVTADDASADVGVHIDHDGQPYAHVVAGAHWSLAASRACLDMLVNPFGTRSVFSDTWRAEQGPAEFLIEVSGTCGDAAYAYAINDVMVSDFCTPAFFQNAPPSASERYSLNGSVRAPFELLPRGQLTWYSAAANCWWSRNHWGDAPVELRLGSVGGNAAAARELLPKPPRTLSPLRAADVLRTRLDAQREYARQPARLRARRLRALIAGRVGTNGERLPATHESNLDLIHDASLSLSNMVSVPAVSQDANRSGAHVTTKPLFLPDPQLRLPEAVLERTASQRHSSPPPLRASAAHQDSDSGPTPASLAPVAIDARFERPPRIPTNKTGAALVIAMFALLIGIGSVWHLQDNSPPMPERSRVASTSSSRQTSAPAHQAPQNALDMASQATQVAANQELRPTAAQETHPPKRAAPARRRARAALQDAPAAPPEPIAQPSIRTRSSNIEALIETRQ